MLFKTLEYITMVKIWFTVSSTSLSRYLNLFPPSSAFQLGQWHSSFVQSITWVIWRSLGRLRSGLLLICETKYSEFSSDKVLYAIIAGTIRGTVQAWIFTNVEFIQPQPRDIVYLWAYSSSQLRVQHKSTKRVRIRLLEVRTLASISSRSICPNTVTFGPASIVWGAGSDGSLRFY